MRRSFSTVLEYPRVDASGISEGIRQYRQMVTGVILVNLSGDGDNRRSLPMRIQANRAERIAYDAAEEFNLSPPFVGITFHRGSRHGDIESCWIFPRAFKGTGGMIGCLCGIPITRIPCCIGGQPARATFRTPHAIGQPV